MASVQPLPFILLSLLLARKRQWEPLERITPKAFHISIRGCDEERAATLGQRASAQTERELNAPRTAIKLSEDRREKSGSS